MMITGLFNWVRRQIGRVQRFISKAGGSCAWRVYLYFQSRFLSPQEVDGSNDNKNNNNNKGGLKNFYL